MSNTRSLLRNSSSSAAVRVSRTFQIACAMVLTPPHPVTQTGRGSSLSTDAMISSEPGLSFPLPTSSIP